MKKIIDNFARFKISQQIKHESDYSSGPLPTREGARKSIAYSESTDMKSSDFVPIFAKVDAKPYEMDS